MNCYTATAPAMRHGINHDTTKPAVVLGETGRSRRQIVVPVQGAITEGTLVLRAGLVRPAALVEPQPGDPVIIRVNTYGTYTRNSGGAVQVVYGPAAVAAEGLWAEGAAGHLGGGPDVLAVMRPGSVLRVVFSGGRSKGYGRRWLVLAPGATAPVLTDLGRNPRPDQAPLAALGAHDARWLREVAYEALEPAERDALESAAAVPVRL